MKFFDPFRTQHCPCRTAVVRIPAASLPAPASVKPQAPRTFPLTSRGRNYRLLRVAAEHRDVRRAQPVVRGDRQRDRRTDTRNLFDADAVVHRGHARPAVLLWKLDPHQSEFRQFGQQVHREMLRLVPLHDVRADLRFGKLTDRLPQEVLIVTEAEVHYAELYKGLAKSENGKAPAARARREVAERERAGVGPREHEGMQTGNAEECRQAMLGGYAAQTIAFRAFFLVSSFPDPVACLCRHHRVPRGKSHAVGAHGQRRGARDRPCVVGFEFEYPHTNEDRVQAAPGLWTYMFNGMVQTPIPIAGMQFYGTAGAGGFHETLNASLGNQRRNQHRRRDQDVAGWSLRLRFDYRVFTLQGSPRYAKPQRFYAGINLKF